MGSLYGGRLDGAVCGARNITMRESKNQGWMKGGNDAPYLSKHDEMLAFALMKDPVRLMLSEREISELSIVHEATT